MRFGLLTPIVVRLPGAHAPWESSAGVDELRKIARTADTLGYHHLTCSEHTAVPVQVATVRGGTYWDPLATLSFLAAATRRIRLATNVLVLGYHHPLALAKSYGTLDRLSAGRVLLGVGVGSLQPEFELLDAPFDDRGPRADDAIRAIRTAWGAPQPTYHGTHYRFDDFLVDPHAPRRRVPIWIGGRSARSLRRAVELGDGWMPFGLSNDQVAALLRRHAPGSDRIEVVLQPRRLDPLGDPGGTRRAVQAAADAGATIINATFLRHSPAHLLEQLHALAEQFGDRFDAPLSDEKNTAPESKETP